MAQSWSTGPTKMYADGKLIGTAEKFGILHHDDQRMAEICFRKYRIAGESHATELKQRFYRHMVTNPLIKACIKECESLGMSFEDSLMLMVCELADHAQRKVNPGNLVGFDDRGRRMIACPVDVAFNAGRKDNDVLVDMTVDPPAPYAKRHVCGKCEKVIELGQVHAFESEDGHYCKACYEMEAVTRELRGAEECLKMGIPARVDPDRVREAYGFPEVPDTVVAGNPYASETGQWDDGKKDISKVLRVAAQKIHAATESDALSAEQRKSMENDRQQMYLAIERMLGERGAFLEAEAKKLPSLEGVFICDISNRDFGTVEPGDVIGFDSDRNTPIIALTTVMHGHCLAKHGDQQPMIIDTNASDVRVLRDNGEPFAIGQRIWFDKDCYVVLDPPSRSSSTVAYYALRKVDTTTVSANDIFYSADGCHARAMASAPPSGAVFRLRKTADDPQPIIVEKPA